MNALMISLVAGGVCWEAGFGWWAAPFGLIVFLLWREPA